MGEARLQAGTLPRTIAVGALAREYEATDQPGHKLEARHFNMQQVARASDATAFMLMHPQTRAGQLIECGATNQIFTHPKDTRAEDYVTGRFG